MYLDMVPMGQQLYCLQCRDGCISTSIWSCGHCLRLLPKFHRYSAPVEHAHICKLTIVGSAEPPGNQWRGANKPIKLLYFMSGLGRVCWAGQNFPCIVLLFMLYVVLRARCLWSILLSCCNETVRCAVASRAAVFMCSLTGPASTWSTVFTKE